MSKMQFVLLAIAAVFLGSLFGYQVAGAGEGQKWILLHHESQGDPSDESWTKCMPDDAWSGHDDHEGDWKEGPFDNNKCEESDPTEVPPTATTVPTDEPTATPTDAPPDQTPTDEPPGPTTTNEPTNDDDDKPERLPNTGALPTTVDPFTWAPDVWREDGLPENLLLTHNGAKTGFGSQVVQLQRGDVFGHPSLGSSDYEVVGVLRVDAEDVWVLDTVQNFDGLVLMTCSGYNTSTQIWRFRVFVFLQEGENNDG